MFCSFVCIVHAFCMVTIHITCYYGDIEVGPDSRKVPGLAFKFKQDLSRLPSKAKKRR